MLHRIGGVFILILVGVLLAYKFSPSRISPESKWLTVLDAEQLKKEIVEGSTPLTLVNLWASWCVPCLKEMPDLLEIRETYGSKVRFLLISSDGTDKKAEALRILLKHKVDFPTYFRGDKGYEELDAIYPDWNGALPANLVLDQKGQVLEAWFGETSKAQFTEILEKHLKALENQ